MDAVVTTLRTVSLFANLPREVLARLVSEFDELELPAGQTVFSQGDPGDALYVVVSGAVEVRGDRGGQRVAVLGPGDCVGEMALVFLLPQQSPYYLTLYYGTEERAFGHREARPFAWVYAGAVLAGFLLSLPYWRALGLVTG
jgi:signal-transduction protein with cAMP-binding, CBS, and nucleotidyltransferase domain